MPQHDSPSHNQGEELSFAVSGAVASSGAAVAPLNTYALGMTPVRKLILVALSAMFALTLGLAAPAPTVEAATATEAQRIVRSAAGYLGGKWVYAATGPVNFDCSGLVYRVFRDNNLATRIGGRKTVRGYYNWFKERGRVSRSNPRVGDLVVWGSNKHIGIYIGDGMAISTLTSGVKRHRVHGLTDPFKAYLHVSLQR